MIATTPSSPARPARRSRPAEPAVRGPTGDGTPPARGAPESPTRALARSPADVRPGLSVLFALLWAAALFAAAAGGPAAMAGLLIPVGVVAALSAARAEPAAKSAVHIPVKPGRGAISAAVGIAVFPSVGLPLAALAGARATLGVGVILTGVVAAVLLLTTRGGFPYRIVLAAICPAIAAASVVLALRQGESEAVTLLAAICLYDMASFVMGTGPRGGPIGVLAGWLTVGALAVFVAAVVVPPYSGRTPWILLGVVAALAPVGVAFCALVARGRRLPALRRLDSLLLAGPGWVIAVSLVLHK